MIKIRQALLASEGEPVNEKAQRIGWWLLFFICLVYALFAFDMFRIELLALLGDVVAPETKSRQAPAAFLLHSFLGGIGLVAGSLQFNRYFLRTNRKIHRFIGWTYLVSIWGASLTGILSTVYFNVPTSAKIVFSFVGSWWFVSTTKAYLYIRQRAIELHRNWMIRSYAVSLFFITFPIWVPTLQAVTIDEIAWPLGLSLAGALNVLIAEYLISGISAHGKE
jgi:hypothetical protein